MATTRTSTAVAALIALAIVLGGCGSTSTTSSSASSTSTSSAASASPAPAPAPRSPASVSAPARVSSHVTVAISSYAYHPIKLVVAPGTKVTFANHDQTAHTATSGGSGASGFDSGTIKRGAGATVTFRRAGTYAYVCEFHAFMHGTIVVK